ncbi:MAG: hypothetical protein AAGE80_13285 [Pseudomonadota bacterium]
MGRKYDRIFVHIGYFKTGTTSIQRCLSSNRELLNEQGVFNWGVDYNFRLAFEVEPQCLEEVYIQNDVFSREERTELKAEILAEINKRFAEGLERGCREAVISSEFLCYLEEDGLRKLKTWLEEWAGSIQIIFYIREHVSCALSKRSSAARFGNPIAQRLINYRSDYDAMLKEWRKLFAVGDIDVRIFSRETLLNGDILDDFFSVIGVDASKFTRDDRSNNSISEFGIEVLEVINRRVPKLLNGRWNAAYFEPGSYFEQVFPATGAMPVPEMVIADFEESYRDADEWIRQEFLPDRPRLFEPYRHKAAGDESEKQLAVTPEQIAQLLIMMNDQMDRGRRPLAFRQADGRSVAERERDAARAKLQFIFANPWKNYSAQLDYKIHKFASKLGFLPEETRERLSKAAMKRRRFWS